MEKSGSTPSKPAYDPGWNDPPKFNYNPNDATPKKVKLNLNKRVAFPLASSSSSSHGTTTELAPSGLPMPHSKNAPPPQMMIPQSSPSSSISPPPMSNRPPAVPEVREGINGTVLVDHDTTELTIDDLKVKAEAAVDYLKQVGREKLDMEEIVARLEMCRRDVDVLSAPVLQLLVQVHEALVDDKIESALHFQQLLMVNHINQCAQWGPTVKRIITITTITTITTEDQQQQQQGSESNPSSSSVPYFQSQQTDAHLFEAPPAPSVSVSPPVSESETLSTPAAATPDQVSATATDSQSSSLFQKLKSRILHI